MSISTNTGSINLFIRAILTVDLLTLSLTGYIPAAAGFLFFPLAGLLLVNRFTGYCWFYQRLNLSTRPS